MLKNDIFRINCKELNEQQKEGIALMKHVATGLYHRLESLQSGLYKEIYPNLDPECMQQAIFRLQEAVTWATKG